MLGRWKNIFNEKGRKGVFYNDKLNKINALIIGLLLFELEDFTKLPPQYKDRFFDVFAALRSG
jgi:hypothetical protein